MEGLGLDILAIAERPVSEQHVHHGAVDRDEAEDGFDQVMVVHGLLLTPALNRSPIIVDRAYHEEDDGAHHAQVDEGQQEVGEVALLRSHGLGTAFDGSKSSCGFCGEATALATSWAMMSSPANLIRSSLIAIVCSTPFS